MMYSPYDKGSILTYCPPPGGVTVLYTNGKPRACPGRPEVAPGWHWIHTPEYGSVEECATSFTFFPGLFTLRVYTAMVKDPFKKWDRVDTFCALLVDLGGGSALPTVCVPFTPRSDTKNSFVIRTSKENYYYIWKHLTLDDFPGQTMPFIMIC